MNRHIRARLWAAADRMRPVIEPLFAAGLGLGPAVLTLWRY